jgi:hypothetical protein
LGHIAGKDYQSKTFNFLRIEKYALVLKNLLFPTENLDPILKPSACSQTSPVFNNGNYEKTLCYVKQKFSYYKARDFCKKLRMQLYRIESSPAASQEIFHFVKSAFGGNKKVFVFIYGMKGKKCLTYSLTGKTYFDWCARSRHFFCEFNDKLSK